MPRGLKQTVTSWRPTRAFNGAAFTAPATQLALWQQVRELFMGAVGDEELSQAKVMLTTSLQVGDYLFLGTSILTDPRGLTGAYEIKAYSEMSNLRGIDTERVAML